MNTILENYIKNYDERRKTQKKFMCVLVALAIIVTTCVFWQLHYTGIALSNDVYCGYEEHTHTDDCYELVLICGEEETEAEIIDVDVENSDLAEDAEVEETTETVETHVHDDSCYEKVLSCELEEHTHTVLCMSDVTADVETESDWKDTLPSLSDDLEQNIVLVAKSQLGYTESQSNFILNDDGEQKGYTRYGAWYGNEYGDWNSMFAAFCLNYAGVDSSIITNASGAYAWSVELENQGLYFEKDYIEATAGELVFFDTNSDGKVDTVGIVSAKGDDNIMVIEGDYDDAVAQNTYSLDDDSIVGYAIVALDSASDLDDDLLLYYGVMEAAAGGGGSSSGGSSSGGSSSGGSSSGGSSSGGSSSSSTTTYGDLIGHGSPATMDSYYLSNHYYHIDVRVDSTFYYTYYEGVLYSVSDTTLTVNKSWTTNDASTVSAVTFYVYDDDSGKQLYWDAESYEAKIYEQTTTVTNYPITLTTSADNSWTDSVDLEPGNYYTVEIATAGYEESKYYFTIAYEGAEKEEGYSYVNQGTIECTGVNWVAYQAYGTTETTYSVYNDAYTYYTETLGLDITEGEYIYIDNSDGLYYTTSTEDSSLDDGEDYEYFLDDGGSYGGRALFFLTTQSTIMINIDYTATYVDQNGNTVTKTVEGATFTFEPKDWIENNYCANQSLEDSRKGVDIKIVGSYVVEELVESSTKTTIVADVSNTQENVTETTYLTGTKTWVDQDSTTSHVYADEVQLVVYRSIDGETWEKLTETTDEVEGDYIVVWSEETGRYYIYDSGSSGVYVGLDAYDSDGNEYQFKVEEVAISGYTTETKIVENTGSGYEYCYNFTNTETVEDFTPPTVTKSVDKTSADIGETLTFTVISEIPDYETSDGESWVFTYTDETNEGITLNDMSDEYQIVVTIGDKTLDIADDELQITLTHSDEGDLLEIIITGLEAYRGETITITYTGYLNGNAEIGTSGENTNTVSLDYACGSINIGTIDAKSAVSGTIVYVGTYQINATKISAVDNTTLSGAEFVLYKYEDGAIVYYLYDEDGVDWVPDLEDATIITSDDDGLVTFSGISLGTYYLLETSAPYGYSLSGDAIEIQVTDEGVVVDDTYLNDDSEIVISNTPNFELPVTGGVGTIIYTTVGLTLIGGATCFMYIIRKRRRREI